MITFHFKELSSQSLVYEYLYSPCAHRSPIVVKCTSAASSGLVWRGFNYSLFTVKTYHNSMVMASLEWLNEVILYANRIHKYVFLTSCCTLSLSMSTCSFSTWKIGMSVAILLGIFEVKNASLPTVNTRIEPVGHASWLTSDMITFLHVHVRHSHTCTCSYCCQNLGGR